MEELEVRQFIDAVRLAWRAPTSEIQTYLSSVEKSDAAWRVSVALLRAKDFETSSDAWNLKFVGALMLRDRIKKFKGEVLPEASREQLIQFLMRWVFEAGQTAFPDCMSSLAKLTTTMVVEALAEGLSKREFSGSDRIGLVRRIVEIGSNDQVIEEFLAQNVHRTVDKETCLKVIKESFMELLSLLLEQMSSTIEWEKDAEERAAFHHVLPLICKVLTLRLQEMAQVLRSSPPEIVKAHQQSFRLTLRASSAMLSDDKILRFASATKAVLADYFNGLASVCESLSKYDSTKIWMMDQTDLGLGTLLACAINAGSVGKRCIQLNDSDLSSLGHIRFLERIIEDDSLAQAEIRLMIEVGTIMRDVCSYQSSDRLKDLLPAAQASLVNPLCVVLFTEGSNQNEGIFGEAKVAFHGAVDLIEKIMLKDPVELCELWTELLEMLRGEREEVFNEWYPYKVRVFVAALTDRWIDIFIPSLLEASSRPVGMMRVAEREGRASNFADSASLLSPDSLVERMQLSREDAKFIEAQYRQTLEITGDCSCSFYTLTKMASGDVGCSRILNGLVQVLSQNCNPSDDLGAAALQAFNCEVALNALSPIFDVEWGELAKIASGNPAFIAPYLLKSLEMCLQIPVFIPCIDAMLTLLHCVVPHIATPDLEDRPSTSSASSIGPYFQFAMRSAVRALPVRSQRAAKCLLEMSQYCPQALMPTSDKGQDLQHFLEYKNIVLEYLRNLWAPLSARSDIFASLVPGCLAIMDVSVAQHSLRDLLTSVITPELLQLQDTAHLARDPSAISIHAGLHCLYRALLIMSDVISIPEFPCAPVLATERRSPTRAEHIVSRCLLERSISGKSLAEISIVLVQMADKEESADGHQYCLPSKAKMKKIIQNSDVRILSALDPKVSLNIHDVSSETLQVLILCIAREFGSLIFECLGACEQDFAAEGVRPLLVKLNEIYASPSRNMKEAIPGGVLSVLSSNTGRACQTKTGQALVSQYAPSLGLLTDHLLNCFEKAPIDSEVFAAISAPIWTTLRFELELARLGLFNFGSNSAVENALNLALELGVKAIGNNCKWLQMEIFSSFSLLMEVPNVTIGPLKIQEGWLQPLARTVLLRIQLWHKKVIDRFIHFYDALSKNKKNVSRFVEAVEIMWSGEPVSRVPSNAPQYDTAGCLRPIHIFLDNDARLIVLACLSALRGIRLKQLLFDLQMICAGLKDATRLQAYSRVRDADSTISPSLPSSPNLIEIGDDQ